MSWISKGLGIALLAVCMVTPAMAARRIVVQRAPVGPRVVLGSRVVVGPRVTPRVIVRPYAPFRSYAPLGWYGYYGTGWTYPVYAERSNTGEVKIDTHLKDASLYVDGGYVGPISKFKKFSLSPGNHDIELRDASGGHIFNQRVQVIVGKSIEVRPAS